MLDGLQQVQHLTSRRGRPLTLNAPQLLSHAGGACGTPSFTPPSLLSSHASVYVRRLRQAQRAPASEGTPSFYPPSLLHTCQVPAACPARRVRDALLKSTLTPRCVQSALTPQYMSGACGMPPGIFFSSADSTITASLVVMRLLTLAASTRAVRTTLRGSMMPALIMSTNCPEAAS